MLSTPEKILQLENVRFQWLDDKSFIPRNGSFNFKLNPNAITCLKAASGYGKSTLLHFIINHTANKENGFLVEGNLTCSYSKISILPQFSQEALHPTFSVLKQIHTFEKSLNIPKSSDDKILRLLLDLGFKHPKEILNRNYSSLSGGQKQRICLLINLLKDPDLLILDEPTSALDEENARLLFNFLNNWVKMDGKAVLCVSHQTEWISDYCDTIVELELPLTFPLNQIKKSPLVAEEILKLDNISFSYLNSDKSIINQFNFSFCKGVFYAISGESGSGKSTLGKIISGHLTNYNGNLLSPLIKVQPRLADSESLGIWRKQFVYVPQNSYALLNGERSFKEELKDLQTLRNLASLDNTAITKWTDILQIESSSTERSLNTLSGGERQKLILLLFLLQSPSILILDEPTAAMDARSKENFINELLPRIKKSNQMCIIVLSHDPMILSRADFHIQL